MKLSTMLLTATLALAAGLSGNALAHDGGWRGHGHENHGRHYAERDYRHRGQGHRHAPRHWRHDHRAYRPHYRPRHDHRDPWYGIHLFFGGH